MELLLYPLLAMGVALVAFVYAEILTAPGMLLNLSTWSYYNWLDRKLRNYPNLFKAVLGCYKCVAGQLAFWCYVYNYWSSYSLQVHVYYVCFAIFSAILLNKLHTWTQQ